MYNTLRWLILAVFGCLVAMGNLACSRDNAGLQRCEKKLFAPLLEQDIDRLIKGCMGKDDLLERCGSPIHLESSNGVDCIEFMVSFDKVHGPTPLMIASFVVVLSNDAIISWRPSSKGRIRGRLGSTVKSNQTEGEALNGAK